MNSAQSQPQKNKSKKKPIQTGDGVTHINIWILGKTELGKMLAHFYHMPFKHPRLGPFNSMEGLWHYVKTEEKDDTLRALSGIKAKDYGKKLTRRHVKDFHAIINAANFYKIEQNPRLVQLMVESDLPFEFYYLFGPDNIKITPPGYTWLVDGFEEIRRMLKEGRRPADEDIDYTPLLDKKA